jgi:mannosyltransferase
MELQQNASVIMRPTSTSERRLSVIVYNHRVALVFFTILGLFLRLYHLNFQSLWYDELHSIIPTAPEHTVSSIISYCKDDQPPFHFLFLHYSFRIFGYNEIIGRVASAIIGVAAIPAIYFLTYEASRRKEAATFSSALLSINPFHIEYSQELRFYSMLFFLATISFLFFIRAYRTQSARDFVIYTIASSALLYTHYYGLLIYGIQVVIFLWLSVNNQTNRRFVIIGFFSGLIVLASFAPWLPVIFADLGIKNFWIEKPSPKFFLDYLYLYFGKDALTTGVVIFLLAYVWKTNVAQGKTIRLVISAWLVLGLAIPYLKSITSTPALHVRYTIVILPAFFVLAAWGWSQINNSKIRNALLIVLVLSGLINLFAVRRYYYKIAKQQFREASAIVKAGSEKLPVLSNFPWHFNYYFRDEKQKVLAFDQIETLAGEEFWLLYVELLNKHEQNSVMNNLSRQFDVKRHEELHKCTVLLLKRKEH